MHFLKDNKIQDWNVGQSGHDYWPASCPTSRQRQAFSSLSPVAPRPQDSLLHIHGGDTVLIHTSVLSGPAAPQVATGSPGAGFQGHSESLAHVHLMRLQLLCSERAAVWEEADTSLPFYSLVFPGHLGLIPGCPKN